MGLYQRWIRDFVYPLALWRRGDIEQLSYLREFEQVQYLPLEDIRDLQQRRLRRLLEHAWRDCPFYRRRFEQMGIVPGDITALDDLRLLPVLEKRDLQEHCQEMLARHWPREDLIANQTGGSTGTPVGFYLSNERRRSRWAATVRHNRWAGWDLGDRVALIWGAPRDAPARGWRDWLRRRLLDRELFLDTACLTEARLEQFHHALKRFRPKVILAYAQAAVLFARYLKSRGWTPYQPRAIVTSAEVLEPAGRKLVEEVFGCAVFNRYGCREVSVIASECPAHDGLHTMAEGLYVEVVRGDSPAAPGEMGTILVTDLLNLAMPLIRYRIGDLGSWSAGPCRCGRGLPRLAEVAGRTTQFVVGDDGRLVSGVFLATYVVAHRPGLGQVQIQQDAAGQVRYRIKPGQGFRAREDLDYLVSSTRVYLGDSTAVDWEFVEEFPVAPSGKFAFCQSKVAPDFLEAPEVPAA